MFGKWANNYYYGKSGKGDFKKDDLPQNRWQLFWDMLRTRLSGLCRLNLTVFAAWLPLIFVIGYYVNHLFNWMNIVEMYNQYLATGQLAESMTMESFIPVKSSIRGGIGTFGFTKVEYRSVIFPFSTFTAPISMILSRSAPKPVVSISNTTKLLSRVCPLLSRTGSNTSSTRYASTP